MDTEKGKMRRSILTGEAIALQHYCLTCEGSMLTWSH
jgi:hypothetical protein